MGKFTNQDYYKNRRAGTKSSPVIGSTIKEILQIAENTLGKFKKELVVLDVGSGSGEYTLEIAKYVKKVVGVEPYKSAYQQAIFHPHLPPNIIFINNLIENYHSQTKFDLVLSLASIEHMPNAKKSFKHIFKLMKKKSLIYLTAPNKWWPMEGHYHLLFLSLLPLPLANFYLKITNKGHSYLGCSYSKSYFGMKSFFDQFKCRYQFKLPSSEAHYLGCGQYNKINHSVSSFGIWLIKKFPLMWIISKGFIMVIEPNN